ncbi:GNAT family N-acetyltransferase [Thalassococcus sp. CAU 1522]|uniref:GNAT family N-acetyltransferase n=1 Tax=Thalassococcus arenae TaxID=2851652 RepID=A0ABS6N4K8_9RHOB|nr:GNAT family N-acetyltransferase [Thalassococcus arenae]MBV2358738.1 GNAT family N-acetyltransferase [Thalassococcus arenae]
MIAEPLRQAGPADLAALTDLCLTAKAHWGYDAAFMSAARDELTVRATDLADPCAVTRDARGFTGFVQVSVAGRTAQLEKLFVAPRAMRRGCGAALLRWACDTARDIGATALLIESDPGAEPFYARMGAVRIGTAPSGSIPGRHLPLLSLAL